jgi:hypothetical protein
MKAHRSFKDKTSVKIPEEQWIKRMNDHEPLVDEDVFCQVQKLMEKRHRTVTSTPKANTYKGLCICRDCGYIMWFTSRNGRKSLGYYTCGRSKLRVPKRGCSTHYITLEQLDSLVLNDVTYIVSLVQKDKKVFINRLIESAEKDLIEANSRNSSELDNCTARIEEISILTRKLYEDRVFGRITEDVYTMLSSSYNDELSKLPDKAKELYNSLLIRRTTDDDICRFANLIEEYADITEMTSTIAHDLIDHITVYDKRAINGTGIRIDIFYRLVGRIGI